MGGCSSRCLDSTVVSLLYCVVPSCGAVVIVLVGMLCGDQHVCCSGCTGYCGVVVEIS